MEQNFEVACLLFNCSSYHEAVERGIRSAVKASQYKNHNLSFYYVSGTDKTIVGAVAEKILQKNSDVIITVGQRCSQVMAGLLSKRQCTTPMVFIGVPGAVELGIIDSNKRPGKNITGVATAPSDSTEDAQILLKIFSKVRKVLIGSATGYDEAKDVEKKVASTKEYFERNAVEVTVCHLDTLMDISNKLSAFLPQYDVFMYLEGSSLEVSNSLLTKLCKKYGTLFFAPSQAAVSQGAPLGYAIDPALTGAEGWRIIERILYEKLNVSETPLHFMSNSRRLFVNSKVYKSYGITDEVLKKTSRNYLKI